MAYFIKHLIGALLLCVSLNTFPQGVACEDLVRFVKKEGRNIGSVSSYELLSSSWLKEVTCYNIDGKLVVIAHIKTNDYSLYGKDYVFCGISKTYWDAFYYGLYDIGKTHGERFHKYIMDYKCDCY